VANVNLRHGDAEVSDALRRIQKLPQRVSMQDMGILWEFSGVQESGLMDAVDILLDRVRMGVGSGLERDRVRIHYPFS